MYSKSLMWSTVPYLLFLTSVPDPERLLPRAYESLVETTQYLPSYHNSVLTDESNPVPALWSRLEDVKTDLHQILHPSEFKPHRNRHGL
jgi:hypothetical protein